MAWASNSNFPARLLKLKKCGIEQGQDFNSLAYLLLLVSTWVLVILTSSLLLLFSSLLFSSLLFSSLLFSSLLFSSLQIVSAMNQAQSPVINYFLFCLKPRRLVLDRATCRRLANWYRVTSSSPTTLVDGPSRHSPCGLVAYRLPFETISRLKFFQQLNTHLGNPTAFHKGVTFVLSIHHFLALWIAPLHISIFPYFFLAILILCFTPSSSLYYLYGLVYFIFFCFLVNPFSLLP